jgi:anti-sigma-K factor RskA
VKKPSRVFAITGWVAAAACLLLLLGALLVKRPVPQPVASVERTKLLAKPETTKLDWSATADPASRRAKGDVVWNAVEQRGFMRFEGLAKNDKSSFQYQLWIFDKNRDDKYPVDGGVFDVDSETGEVVVPITARLKVDEPVLFAVTVEKPGGVVVSKRERIVVTAKPSAG